MKYIIAILLALGSFAGVAAAHGPRYYPPRYGRPHYGFYYRSPSGWGYYHRWDHYPRRPHHRHPRWH